MRQAGEDEDQPQSSLARRLRGDVGERNGPAEADDALRPLARSDSLIDVGELDQLLVEGHIDRGDCVEQGQGGGKVADRPKSSGSRKALAFNDFTFGQFDPANGDAGARRDPDTFRDRDLNRIAGRQIESMQPGGGPAGEGGSGRQAAEDCFESE